MRERCEECVCVFVLSWPAKREIEMIFVWLRGNSQIDGIGGSQKKSDAFFFQSLVKAVGSMGPSIEIWDLDIVCVDY